MRNAPRSAPTPSSTSTPSSATSALRTLQHTLAAQDEVEIALAARSCLHRGASLVSVFETVLAHVEVLRASGASLLDLTDSDLRARRIVSRVGGRSTPDDEQVLLFVDEADTLTMALIRVLEDSGRRARVAVTEEPEVLLDLTAEQPWSAVVVDHAKLRRCPETTERILEPILRHGTYPVVATHEGWTRADAGPARPRWSGRELRQLAAACGVIADNPLTDREREVLVAVAAGRSNEQVGRALQLSLSTVKTYLERIHVKLGSVDRASAVATALRRGWI